jgi:hypothetical protein
VIVALDCGSHIKAYSQSRAGWSSAVQPCHSADKRPSQSVELRHPQRDDVVAELDERGEPALQVQETGDAAHIEDRRAVPVAPERGRELPRPLFFRPRRDPDQEAVVDIANVAAVQRAGRFDLAQRRRKSMSAS